MTFLHMVSEAPPAGGAEATEVVLATAGAAIATTALFVLGWAHRTGRTTLLDRVAAAAGRSTGLPAWAGLPTQVAAASLLCAVFGMYWDISLHIDDGRDAGPLANPAHYFILFGLFGVFAAGFLAVVLPRERPSAAAVRIGEGWYAPIGGVAMLACSAFSLSGFPLDDVWHRLFGQDVTLWGPTHLMLIGGAGLSLVGQAMLVVEGRAQATQGRPRGRVSGLLAFAARQRHAAICGGFLVGLSTFQAEFDFGVPQFRLLFHPLLIAVAAGIALVAARIYVGRWGALQAAVYFIVIRGLLAILVGPGLGETVPYLPLYLAEALLVEAAARYVAPRRRQYAFGALAGLLIGTVGFLAEYAYSQVGFPVPWPSRLLAEGAVLVPLAAVASGLVGAFIGSALHAPRDARASRLPRGWVAAAAVAVIALAVGYGLRTDHAQDVRAAVTLTDVTAGPDRTVHATVRIEPAAAAEDVDWLSAIAWQGQGFHLDHLERIGPGVYRTTEPLPVHGTWKALIRLHDRQSMVGLPVYLPEDRAIPAPAVSAPPRFERTFIADKRILQREAKQDVSASLWTPAYGAVGAIVLALLAILGWALARVGGASGRQSGAVPPGRLAAHGGRA